MLGSKKLRPNLYSDDLIYGKIDLKPRHDFSCFFIVQHMDNKEFIKEQLLQLLLAGCQHYDFYGEMKQIWQLGFAEANTLLFSISAEHNCCDFRTTVEEFAEALIHAISVRSFVPHDYYLLYDDAGIYEKVIQILNEHNR